MRYWPLLRIRIAYELGIECADDFERATGAWSWRTSRRGDPLRKNIGSEWTMGQLLDAERLGSSAQYGGISIYPEERK